jgi:hypothetical protein
MMAQAFARQSSSRDALFAVGGVTIPRVKRLHHNLFSEQRDASIALVA